MKIVVLGAGMVGATIAKDLARCAEIDVLVADNDENALGRLSGAKLRTKKANLSQAHGVREVAAGARVAVNALPGFLGFRTLRELIEAGCDIVDISFMPEDQLLLDEAARAKGVTAVVDFGVAPGMSNFLCGRARTMLDRAVRCMIMVGGVPKRRMLPWEYRMPFSPLDVLEEHLRPARLVESGRVVEKPPLSEPELVDLPGAGTMEAFNTDGLRTLIRTLDAPDMKEKTLRYPGYTAKMQLLVKSGFLGTEKISMGSVSIRPIDLTARLLFEAWRLGEGEEELTVMRVEMEGEKDGKSMTFTYDLYDEYDRETHTTSMARTTGYPASIMARMIALGEYSRPGVIPPELIGRELRMYEAVMTGLKERGVNIKESVVVK